jgi:hypothetical protein
MKRAAGFVRQIATPSATWKDPRMTLLLPFWQPLLPPTRYILCIRNPLDVADSLARRDGMPLELALTLWMLYTTYGLVYTQPDQPLLVFYEDLLGPEHDGQVQRIVSFLGDPQTPDSLSGVIRPEYSHGAHDLNEPLSRHDVPEALKTLWAALLALHSSRSEQDLQRARSVASTFTPPSTPWTTAQKYRMNFWARQIKMQLLEEWNI